MQIPSTNSPLYFFIDPDPAYIVLSTAALPLTLQISAATNRAGLTGLIAPDSSTTTTQPGWSKIGITTPFYTANWPGSYYTSGANSAATTGTAGFTFNGNQYFSCDSFASNFNGVATGITVVGVVQNGASGTGTVWQIGTSTTGLELKYSTSTNLQLIDHGAAGANANITVVANSVYVVTASRSASGLMLRAQIATASTFPPTATSSEVNLLTGNQTTYTGASNNVSLFTIGAQNNGTTAAPTIANQFTGNIGQLMVFGIAAGQTLISGGSTLPCADIERVEADMLIEYGITLGDYNATTSLDNAV
jgi:hypothetical protein